MSQNQTRKPSFDIHPLILNRWSARSMTGEEVDDNIIMSLFEAARWAPSSFNNQPWRFVYAKRNTVHWDTLFNLLLESNKKWAKNAAVLVVIVSRKNFEYNGKFSSLPEFSDTLVWA
jgi:nitroreductase